MFHSLGITVHKAETRLPLAQMQRMTSQLEVDQGKYVDVIADRCKFASRDDIVQLFTRETHVGVDYALKTGIIHKVARARVSTPTSIAQIT